MTTWQKGGKRRNGRAYGHGDNNDQRPGFYSRHPQPMENRKKQENVIPLYRHETLRERLLACGVARREPIEDHLVRAAIFHRGNPGLWYDKFCLLWKKGKWEFDKNKWVQLASGEVGDDTAIAEYVARLTALVYDRGGMALDFYTDGRLVTGLGRSHPVENGLVWHPTLGVPYLPGSSVKGMVRAWVGWKRLEGQATEAVSKCIKEEDIKRIFGDLTDLYGAGSVLFFDALPTGVVRLEADVMTPHYAPYYQGHADIPGDWYNPVPIPFLTVGANQRFRFFLAPRFPECPQDREDVRRAKEWLVEALDILGAGAKTALSYGRFRPVSEEGK